MLVRSSPPRRRGEASREPMRALDRDEEARKLAGLDAAIDRGISDADAGRVHDTDEVFEELRAKYTRIMESPDR